MTIKCLSNFTQDYSNYFIWVLLSQTFQRSNQLYSAIELNRCPVVAVLFLCVSFFCLHWIWTDCVAAVSLPRCHVDINNGYVKSHYSTLGCQAGYWMYTAASHCRPWTARDAFAVILFADKKNLLFSLFKTIIIHYITTEKGQIWTDCESV